MAQTKLPKKQEARRISNQIVKNDAVKHNKVIEQLQRDNKLLKQELSLETRQNHIVNNSSAMRDIKKLQDLGDEYTRKIELEKRRINELDKQIEIVREKVHTQRQKMGGLNASRQNNLVISKQIQVLENRLDKALVRYNETLGQNKSLRDKIDNFRRERMVFDGIYKKLEKELFEEKNKMSDLIEDCNEAYKERDVVKHEIDQLKQQANQEQEKFQKEWKRLSDLIEKDKLAKDLSQLPDEKAGKYTSEDEKSIKAKIAKGAWAIGKDKAQIQISTEKVQTYEESFARIQAATGINDVDELVERFIQAEDRNFSLFNYVNELSGDIEKLEGQISEVRAEIDKYRGQGANSENQRKRILRDLEQRLEKTNNKADAYEQQYLDSLKVLNQLKTGIGQLFNKIGCNSAAAVEILGSDGVTESNMMQHLGMIEQRANEILQMFAATQSGGVAALQNFLGGSGDADTSPGQSNSLTAPNQSESKMNQLVVDPPTLADMETPDNGEENDDDERPLSLTELQNDFKNQMKENPQKKPVNP